MNAPFDNASYALALDAQNETVEENDIDALLGTIDQIETIVCPILFLVGVSGNLCILATVLRVRFRKMTSRYILCALAISDTMLLTTNPFNQNFMVSFWGRDLRALSRITCKLFFIVYRVGKISASWFIVMVAIERFIAVMYPLKVRSILRKRNIYIIIAIIYAIVIIFTGLWSFSTDISPEEICRPDFVTTDTKRAHKVFVIMGACLFSLIPFTVLLFLTPPTVIVIIYKHRIRKRIQQLHSSHKKCTGVTSRISLMLIGVVISYVILVTPITLVLVITVWTGQPIFGSIDSRMVILQAVGLSLEQLNNACNFIIYNLCSTQFRQQFFQTLRCKKSSSQYVVQFRNIPSSDLNAPSAVKISSTLL